MRRRVIEGDARQYYPARARRANVDDDGVVVRSVVILDDSIVSSSSWEFHPIVRASPHDVFEEIRRYDE